MSYVRNIGDIEENAFELLDIVYDYSAHRPSALKLIKGGRVFYPIHYEDRLAFVPSKFIGYRGNSVAHHEKVKQDELRDGRDTNEAIRRILGSPSEDVVLEECLRDFCSTIGVELENHKHRFWRLQTARRFLPPSGSAINDIISDEAENKDPEYRKRMAGHYVRDPKVRTEVLRRSAGKCEECGELGFLKKDGSRYLETHHVISLSEQGHDKPQNVIALCPNDHRRAHFSKDWLALQERFLKKLKRLCKSA